MGGVAGRISFIFIKGLAYEYLLAAQHNINDRQVLYLMRVLSFQ
jgi:hypothetical protein